MASFKSIQTVPIAATVAGNNTILAAVPNERWVVTYMVLAAAAAETFQIFSGATAVTGLIPIPAATGPVLVFENAGNAVLRGKNVNEALIIANTGGADITGWAMIEMTG